MFLQSHILLYRDRQDVVHSLKLLFEGSNAVLLNSFCQRLRIPAM